MGQFDVYKWNNERRLAAVNEGVNEEKSKYDSYLDVVIKHLKEGDVDQDTVDYLERMRNYITIDMQSGDMKFEEK